MLLATPALVFTYDAMLVMITNGIFLSGEANSGYLSLSQL